MNISRISFFSLLLFSILFSPLTFAQPNLFSSNSEMINPIDKPVRVWESSYLNRMTPQELQITANILYLLYANSIIEMKIRQFTTPIARLQQSVRAGIDAYKNVAHEIATLKTLLDRLSYVAGTRTVYAQTLNTCMAEYTKNPTPMIEAALEVLQRDAQVQLRTWADAQTAETSLQLKKSSTFINESMEHLQGVTRLHKGMSEGLMPIEISPADEVNKSLIVLSIVLKNNPELIAVNEEIINTLNQTTEHAALIIQAGIDIYKDYYTVIYNKLMSSNDKLYATMLFSMYGELPEEYKSVLPDADHVFEHALQTTKLYTQTEFLPS
jgi:hypothetical protein